MNTLFVMGRYQMALDHSTDDVGFMEVMALDALGRKDEALQRVRSRDRLPPLRTKWLAMLEMYLEGSNDAAAALILEIDREGTDPEGFFYRVRLLARLGRVPEALKTLESSLEAGFYCATAWQRDCYFEVMRGNKRFRQLLQVVVERCSQTKAAFVAAGGDF